MEGQKKSRSWRCAGGGIRERMGQEKRRQRTKKKNRQKKYLHSCRRAKTAEKLSVIKALTASDSDIAPFCSGPITALTGIQNRPGCHVER